MRQETWHDDFYKNKSNISIRFSHLLITRMIFPVKAAEDLKYEKSHA